MTALMGIATRLKLARLLWIAPDTGVVSSLARPVFAGGADIIALADDPSDPIADATADDALAGILEAARVTQGLSGYFGRTVSAAKLSPDVVVLVDPEANTARARQLLGEWSVIGRECHDRAAVDAALADPCVDFLLVGPGLELVRYAASVAPAHDPDAKPWFAVRGISPRSLDAVVRAGAMRVAVGAAITDAADPGAVASALKNGLREAWNADARMEEVTRSAFGGGPKLTFPPSPGAADGEIEL
ncbi:thiamine phosphate synthase [Propioniciclava soli]|uniref:thiamine phosphate synthase n=1 Tax=Propioniciclava soli TaxID=2775081 RepID=UPI001E5DE6E6